ncbi:hypothetical protein [Xanthobacter versatilis]|uniref:hypothetical protein n=1 Tax=Xanthobacter autotrophicus (strain ATCC BAA-1158 / Py2) TaxID=78245 RepID=UPI0037298EB9
MAYAAEQGPWTPADLDRVTDAALDILNADSTSVRTGRLRDLARALQRAGRTERSREVLLEAAAKLDPPTDFFNTSSRAEIVQSLAKIGDEADAMTLAGVQTQPDLQAMLLGALGEGLAEAGRTDAAVDIAGTIMALSIPPESKPVILDPRINALGKIGTAMSKWSVSGTVAIAAKVPGTSTSLRILRDLAQHICKPLVRPADRPAEERLVSEAAAQAARTLQIENRRAAPSITDVALAVEAIALCDGPQAASSFLAEALSPTDALQVMAEIQDRVLSTRDARLAAAVVFPLPGDVESQFKTTQILVLAGRNAEAREMALAAAGKLAGPDSSRAVSRALIEQAFEVLAQVGEPDTAVSLAEKLDVRTRQSFYSKTVSDQIRRHDREALSWMVPAAVATFQQPGGESVPTLLVELTRRLAVAGYQADAQKPYEAYQAYLAQGKPLPPNLWRGQKAAMQAVMGDLEGARATANAAGPLVAPPSDLQVMAATAMAFAAPGSKPTPGEVAAMAQRIKTEMGLRPGPKALALSEIVSDLACQGQIAEAWKFEAELEPQGPNDEVVAEARDAALAALADAQLMAGDPQAALSTTLRITPPSRLRSLLKLAAVSPRP